MALTQAEMEVRYDAERSGQLYVKAPPVEGAWEAILDIIADPTNDGQLHTDTPLSDVERAAIGALYPDITAILTELDGGEDEDDPAYDRFDRAVDAVALLPADLRERATCLLEGFLAGVAIGNAVK